MDQSRIPHAQQQQQSFYLNKEIRVVRNEIQHDNQTPAGSGE
ncbi:hypothetical protein [Chlorobaculum parvum]|nr:hypothetical protein [Chlorobaculum parvum]